MKTTSISLSPISKLFSTPPSWGSGEGVRVFFFFLLFTLLFPLTAGAQDITYYDLWLGSTQVTSANKDNILNQVDADGNPTAKFDLGTRGEYILTLNNPTIIGSHNNSKICVSGSTELNIVGSYHMAENDYCPYGIYSEYGIVINGDFTFYGEIIGVYAKHQVDLESGSLKAIGGEFYGLQCKNLHIMGIGMSVEIKGYYNAVMCYESVELHNDIELSFTTPEGGHVDRSEFLDAHNKIAKHVIFTTIDSYDIWLGETEVTPANKDNILNQVDANGNPTAKYNARRQRLTLNNPIITGTHTFGTNNETAVIYSERPTVNLRGTYHQTEATAQYGVASPNEIIIHSGDYTFRGTSYGLYANRCYLDLDSRLLDENTMTLSGGTGAMWCPNYDYFGESITLPQGETGYYKSPSICDSDGNIAKEAELKKDLNNYIYLYLGYTQVVPNNCNDIFGDGKASFDPVTRTLTLNNPTIPGIWQESKIYSDRMNLTIKGSYHMTEAETSHAIYLDSGGSLTLDGDFTLYGTGSCIFADNITVKSGSLTAVGMDELGGGHGIWGNSLTIEDEVSYVELQGGSYALNLYYGGGLHLAEGYEITTPENGIFQNNVIYHSDGTTIAKTAVIQNPTNPIQFYDLWVGGKHVSNRNQNDIFGDGQASFDPTTNTLTLTGNPTISGTTNNSKIYSELSSLTVTGSYHMTEAETKNGIYSVSGPLTLNGDFTFLSKGDWLTDSNGNTSLNTGNTIWAVGDITLNGNITIQGQDVAFSAIYTESGNITVQGGNLQASSNNTCAAYCGGTFTANGSAESITLEGSPAAIHAGNFVIDNAAGQLLGYYEPENAYFDTTWKSIYRIEGNTGVLATRVVLRQPQAYNLWVGSTRVNEANCDDILGDGKAKYNPVTATLTLDNPTISGHNPGNGFNSKIASEGIDLTLKGVYRMEAVEGYVVVGLSVSGGTLTMEGDFTFQGLSTGVEVTDDMSVKGHLHAVGSQLAGIEYTGSDAGKGLTLERGFIGETKVELDGGLYANIYGSTPYHIGQSGLILAEPANGYINDYYCRIKESSGENATHAVLTLKGTASGQGTEQIPYRISSREEWAAACADVANGVDLSGKYVALISDITIRKMLGTELNPFNGIFDGYGCTLTSSINENTQGAAPFHTISGATIKNLKVAGTVKGQSYNSGLVGYVKGDGNLIQNCEVSASIGALGGYNGGFVAHAGSYATTLEDCVFRGGFFGTYAFSILNNGTFVGWNETGAQLTMNRCLDLTQNNPIGRGQVEPTSATNIYSMYDKSTITGNNAWENTVPQLAYMATGSDVNLTLTGTTGLEWNNTIYAKQGETIEFTVDNPYATYISTVGTLNQDQAGNCTLVMPGENVTIVNEAVALLAITLAPYEHGSVTVQEGSRVGAKVFMSITPDIAYLLDEVTVTDADGDEYEVEINGKYYCFTMPNKAVTVTVTFKKQYSFENGVLHLLCGDFNTGKRPAWDTDVTDHLGEVLKVTADEGVHFTQYCGSLFRGFINCTEIDLSNVNTLGLVSTAGMFENCLSLTKLDMTGWETQQIGYMNDMFKSCSSLREIDLSGFHVSAETGTTCMFYACDVYKLTLPAGMAVTAPMRLRRGYYTSNSTSSLKKYNYSGWQLLGNKDVVSGSDQDDGITYATLPAQPTTATFVWKKMPDDFVLELPDGEDNSAVVEAWDGVTTNVQLTGRKLWKDGDWNTLCLPFEFTSETGLNIFSSASEQLVLDTEHKYNAQGIPFDPDNEYHHESDYPLQTGFDATTGTLTLCFQEPEEFAPCTPYIIRWNNDTENPYFESPEFRNVIINKSMNSATSKDGRVSFVGTYDYHAFTSTDHSILFLGTENTLYSPVSGTWIGPCRGYFKLSDPNAAVRAFVLNFGDGDITGIENREQRTENRESWFTLDGRKVNGQSSMVNGQLPPGIYIHNGKKVVIK